MSRLQRLVEAAHSAFQKLRAYRLIEAFQNSMRVFQLVFATFAPPFLGERE